MRRRAFLATAGAVGLAGCLQATDTSGPHDVGMTARAFDPAAIEVAVGTEVVWRNTSGTPHTVTAYGDQLPDGAEYFASGGFASEQAARDGWNGFDGGIQTEETYSHTFEVPGEYGYFCIPHEPAGMTGTVTVTESGSGTSV